MKKRHTGFRKFLALALTLALVLPLTGPAVVMEAGAVTQAEIDALKSDASKLNDQKKSSQSKNFLFFQTGLGSTGFHHDHKNMKSSSQSHENTP